MVPVHDQSDSQTQKRYLRCVGRGNHGFGDSGKRLKSFAGGVTESVRRARTTGDDGDVTTLL